jgi:NAD(P)-dependent dehydrogenase (short-subunit alcohol dehydrogenase family)
VRTRGNILVRLAGLSSLAPPARRSVVITDVRPGDAGKEAAEQIAAATDTRCVYVHCDVSKRSEVTTTIDKVAEQFGEIDILVNNGP